MTRTSNSIDDLFAGMTLDLLATSDSAITIKSEVDLASARNAITDFVTKEYIQYNQIDLVIHGDDTPFERLQEMYSDAMDLGILILPYLRWSILI